MTVRKGLTRHDMKQDELVSTMTRAVIWAEENTRKLLMGLGAVVVLAIVLIVAAAWQRSRGEEAYRRLAEVQKAARTPLAAEVGPGTESFASARERSERVEELADRMLESHSRGQAAAWARYYRAAALLELGRSEEASKAADDVARGAGEGSLLSGLALMMAGQAEEARSNLDRAIERYVAASKIEAPGFPAELALLRQASCLDQLGKTSEAMEAYQKVVTDYPDSPLAARADRKLRELRGEGVQGL